MTLETKEENKESLGFLNLLILLLSFYVLIALLVDTLFKLPPEISKLLNYIDNIICIVFLLDFSIRFRKAENKLAFMKWGWIDLIASIPTFDFMRAGRLLRVIRLIRLFRAYRSAKHIVQHVFKNKIQGTLTSVAIIAVLMLLFSSIAILQFETEPESNIKTAEDAIWWSYVTITTVGYGDKYPVTTEGRVIAVILITVGVGLFGTFTAFVSSWFVKSNQQISEREE
ncbi:MAG: ion transporter [Bacteroidota bacterium]|nr:ion transporter [Bacteroidota bacterium]MDP3144876.1 ion transporter [Bacteroidota bacterium]